MGSTLDKPFRAIKKLVGHPLQRDAAMRTAVLKNGYLVALAHGEQRLTLVIQAFAARVGELIQAAQGLRQKVVGLLIHGQIIATLGQGCQLYAGNSCVTAHDH